MALALRTGFNSRRSLYAGQNLPMDAADLAEWEAFYRLQPFDDERMDLMLAQLTAVCAAPHTRSPAARDPKSYMRYRIKEKTPEMSESAMRAAVAAFRQGVGR